MHQCFGRRSVHSSWWSLRSLKCWFLSHLDCHSSPSPTKAHGSLDPPGYLCGNSLDSPVTSMASEALSVWLLGRLHSEPQVQALPGAARKQRHGVWFPAGAAEVFGTALDYHQCPEKPGVLTLQRRHQPLLCYCVASAAMPPAVMWGCLESERGRQVGGLPLQKSFLFPIQFSWSL